MTQSPFEITIDDNDCLQFDYRHQSPNSWPGLNFVISDREARALHDQLGRALALLEVPA